MKAFTIIITFSIMLAFSHATPILVTLLQSQMNQSSTFNLTQGQVNKLYIFNNIVKNQLHIQLLFFI